MQTKKGSAATAISGIIACPSTPEKFRRRCLAGGGSGALRIAAPSSRRGIRGRWTMMVDSSNDLGLRTEFKEDARQRGRRAVRAGRRGILSRFLAALPVDLSFSHNRARHGDIPELAIREIIVLPPSLSPSRSPRPPSVSFRRPSFARTEKDGA